jgi:hypothetical protein
MQLFEVSQLGLPCNIHNTKYSDSTFYRIFYVIWNFLVDSEVTLNLQYWFEQKLGNSNQLVYH